MTTVETRPELHPGGLRLVMPAVPANVSLARQIVSGLTDALDVDAGRSADMKIAITEAVTNVVVHAYPEVPGLAEIVFTTLPEYVVVSVRDRGVGFKPMLPPTYVPANDAPTSGYGLALIGTLSDEFAIMSGASGTEVQMLFMLGDQPAPDSARIFTATSQMAAGDGAPVPERLTLSIGRTEPVLAILGRMVSLLAARAGFSIDRLSDAQLVSDSLARHAPAHAQGESVSVSVAESDGAFELTIGPFAGGGGAAVIAATALPGLGSLLERLSDELDVQPGPDGDEHVRLRLARR